MKCSITSISIGTPALLNFWTNCSSREIRPPHESLFVANASAREIAGRGLSKDLGPERRMDDAAWLVAPFADR